jgi:hypothetical protein
MSGASEPERREREREEQRRSQELERERAVLDEGDDEEDAPRNPFDNPHFLPVLLLGLSIWFGYDGWINQDEHMLKPSTLWFNRIGFAVLVAGGLWTLRRARREGREKAKIE